MRALWMLCSLRSASNAGTAAVKLCASRAALRFGERDKGSVRSAQAVVSFCREGERVKILSAPTAANACEIRAKIGHPALVTPFNLHGRFRFSPAYLGIHGLAVDLGRLLRVDIGHVAQTELVAQQLPEGHARRVVAAVLEARKGKVLPLGEVRTQHELDLPVGLHRRNTSTLGVNVPALLYTQTKKEATGEDELGHGFGDKVLFVQLGLELDLERGDLGPLHALVGRVRLALAPPVPAEEPTQRVLQDEDKVRLENEPDEQTLQLAHKHRLLQQPLEARDVVERVVRMRCDPVLGADELRERLGVLGQVRHTLGSRASVADQHDVLAVQRHRVIPLGRVEDGSLERLVAFNVASLGLRKTAYSTDEKLADKVVLFAVGAVLAPVLAPHVPQTRLAIVPRLLHGGLEVKVLLKVVLGCNRAKVVLELLLLRVERRPVALGGKRKRVDGRRHIACTARIGVVGPCACRILAAFEDLDVVNVELALELASHADAGDACAHDDHIVVLGREHWLLARWQRLDHRWFAKVREAKRGPDEEDMALQRWRREVICAMAVSTLRAKEEGFEDAALQIRIAPLCGESARFPPPTGRHRLATKSSISAFTRAAHVSTTAPSILLFYQNRAHHQNQAHHVQTTLQTMTRRNGKRQYIEEHETESKVQKDCSHHCSCERREPDDKIPSELLDSRAKQSNLRTKPRLVVRGEAPLAERHRLGRSLVGSRERVPLRLPQDLEGLGARLGAVEVDLERGDAGVDLVRVLGRRTVHGLAVDARGGRTGGGEHCIRRAQDLHLHRLGAAEAHLAHHAGVGVGDGALRERGRLAVRREADGAVGLHTPLDVGDGARLADLVLNEHLSASVEHADTSPHRASSLAVAAAEVGDEGYSVSGSRLEREVARLRDAGRGVVVDGQAVGDVLVLHVDRESVLAVGGLAVIGPARRALRLVGEVVGREVVAVAVLAGPARSERIDHKVASVEVTVRLVSGQVGRLDADKDSARIGPRGSHADPRAARVVKVSVERQAVPEGALGGGLVPEHAERIEGCIGAVTLVEGGSRIAVELRVEHELIGGGGELVRAVVSVRKETAGARDVHVEVGSLVPVGVGRHQALVSAVVVSAGHAVSPHVGEGRVDDAVSDGSLVGVAVAADGEGAGEQAAVADAVPVAVSVLGQPPPTSTLILSLTGHETVVDDRTANHGFLVVGPVIVEPVVRHGEGRGHLGDVEEVIRVPVSAVLPKVGGRVTSGSVELEVEAVLEGSVLGDLVGVGEGLDTLLDLAADVEDARAGRAAVEDILNGRLRSPVGSVVEDCGVPDGKVGIVGDLCGQAVPLGLGGHDTRVRTEAGEAVGGGPRVGAGLVVGLAGVGGSRAAAYAAAAAAATTAAGAAVVLGGSRAEDATDHSAGDDEEEQRDTELDPLGHTTLGLGIGVGGGSLGSSVALLALAVAGALVGVEALVRLLIGGALVAGGMVGIVVVSGGGSIAAAVALLVGLLLVALRVALLVALIVLRRIRMDVGVLGSLIRHFVQSLEVGLLIVMSNEEADRRANKSRGSRDERRARERDLPRTVAPTYLDGPASGESVGDVGGGRDEAAGTAMPAR
ncbi:hypothetical protein L1887_58422 [Cichorium endivia]|nr:hypothetical protein L1887_58422 [Cichorium endivia]